MRDEPSTIDVFALRDTFLAEHPEFEEAMRLCAKYEQMITPQVRTYTEIWRDGKPVRRTWNDTNEPVEAQPAPQEMTVIRDGETWRLWQCSCGRWYKPGQFCCY